MSYKYFIRPKLISQRKLKGFTQQQMADKLDIRRNTYTQYETGASMPSFPAMLRIKSILEYYDDDLFFTSNVTECDDNNCDNKKPA